MAKPLPKVSIGLPVYNGERYLAKAIKSVLDQTYEDFELIVVDNASTDGTRDIAQHYAAIDRRVLYVRNQRNLGAAPNFNRAVELARGEYFKWAAHDDMLEPQYLALCVDRLDRDPDVVLAHTRIRLIGENDDVLAGYDREDDLFDHPDPITRYANAINEWHWCITIFGVMRRNLLNRTPRIASYVGSDRTLLAQLALFGRIVHAAEPAFLSRDHDGRSIRALNLQERGVWFDTTKPASGHLYSFRMLRHHLKVLNGHPMSPVDRIRGWRQVGSWTWRMKIRMAQDVQWILAQRNGRPVA